MAFIWQNRRVYAYAPQGRITHYQIQGRPGSIGPFKASILGLPSIWSRYIFIAVMALLAVAFFAPALMSLPWKRQSSHTSTHLTLWRRCLCVLIAYVMLISPVGFESLARADTLYSQLQTTDWHSGDRTIQYSYDQNGSVTQKVTKDTTSQDTLETVIYKYNLQNRLKSVTVDGTTTSYKYNPDGIRVEKNENGTVTQYVIDPYNHTGYAQVLEEWDTTSTPTLIKTYTIADDVITQATSTSIEHLLHDGHASTRQTVDDSEAITDSFSYDAYGVLLGNPATTTTNLLYAGEQFDIDAQQYYLRARYYDPLSGRFNRLDPASGNNQDPQSLHKYLYCHANPINNTDPSGEFFISLVLAFVISAIMFIGLPGCSSSDVAKKRKLLKGKPILDVAAGLEGQLHWQNPVNDFHKYFYNGKGDPWELHTMNCWQFILYCAWINGKYNKSKVKQVDEGIWPSIMNNIETYSPKSKPKPRDLVFFYYRSRGRRLPKIPQHVALSLGGSDVWSLWRWPRMSVSRTNFREIEHNAKAEYISFSKVEYGTF